MRIAPEQGSVSMLMAGSGYVVFLSSPEAASHFQQPGGSHLLPSPPPMLSVITDAFRSKVVEEEITALNGSLSSEVVP